MSTPTSPTDAVFATHEVKLEIKTSHDQELEQGQTGASQEQPMPASPWKAGKQVWLIMLCLSISSLAVALDATVIATSLPVIAVDLNSTANETFWVGSAYLMTSAVFQPFIAALSDILGRRELFIASLLFFTVGTILSSQAHHIITLLAGRAVQGIGGGGIIVLSMVIITDIVPMRQRPRFIAIPTIFWAIGTIVGPVIGGAFAQHVSWRWSFYIVLPFCGIGLLLAPFVIRIHKQYTTFGHRLMQLDWTGNLIFIGSVTSFLIGITWGGNNYPWSDYHTLVPIIVGVVGILLCLIWEGRFASKPFIRFAALSDKSALAVQVCGLLQGFLLYAETYYLAFWLASIKRKSPTATGVDLFPMMLGVVPSAAITGILITRTGRFTPAVRSGWAVGTLGVGLFILLSPSIPTAAWAVIFLVMGIGQGVTVNAQSATVQAISPPQDVAYTIALYTFMRTVGISLGVSIGGTIFQNRLAHYLAVASLPVGIANDAEGFLALLKLLPASDEGFVSAVLEAYSRAFRFLFEIMLGISGLGLVLGLLIRHRDMDDLMASEHVLMRDAEENREKVDASMEKEAL